MKSARYRDHFYRTIGCLLLGTLFFSCLVPGYATDDLQMRIAPEDSTEISDMLYGIFLEDISYACDGGLVANLVNNNSFEYETNALSAWRLENLDAVVENTDSMNENNPQYLAVTGGGVLRNIGFTELYDYKTWTVNEEKHNTPDMGFQEGERYQLTAFFKNIDFSGTVTAAIDNGGDGEGGTIDLSDCADWTKKTVTLTSGKTADGSLIFTIEGSGTFYIDMVTLVSENSYGFGTEEWKNVTLRSDLVQALEDLNPAFIRFPGGCFAEGDSLERLYDWKQTIGATETRRQGYNLWRDDESGREYINTNAMGYYEYFRLCADLGAQPLPILNVGLTCQGRNDYENQANRYKDGAITEEEWEAYLDTIALRPGTAEWDAYVQDIFDLIEFANGDASTEWGSVRAENGSEEPFNLKYIGLGNENWGQVFWRNFDALYQALKERYPDITIITSAGTWLEGTAFEGAWRRANETYTDTIVDEHYYTGDSYLFSHNDRYDSYDRNGAGVFVGEYAVTPQKYGTIQTKSNLIGAIEEASFMTGFERNGDIVKMASYAPTFAKLNAQCWTINMIWFDSQSVALSPSYYVQMLYSNNTGDAYITAENEGDWTELYHSVTYDRENGYVYIKLVNHTGEKRTVHLDASAFGAVQYADMVYLQDNYLSACNEVGKAYTIVPEQRQLDAANTMELVSDKNSVSIVRLTLNDGGEGLWQLPDHLPDTVTYLPPVAKGFAIGVPCLAAVLVIAGLIIGKAVKKRKARKTEV